MKPKKKFPGQGQFDKINSTYKNIIYFNNTQRVPFLEGYSKGLLFNEALDKTVLLEAWIVRLFNRGYLDCKKMVRIDFFLKSFLGNDDELIFSLQPFSFTIVHDSFIMNERLNSFLERFYAQIKSGNIITKNLTHKREKEEIFPLKKGIFKNDDELRVFCIKKIREGHPEGLVKGFFYKYKEKFFENWLEIP